jgi:hypothetical protein
VGDQVEQLRNAFDRRPLVKREFPLEAYIDAVQRQANEVVARDDPASRPQAICADPTEIAEVGANGPNDPNDC